MVSEKAKALLQSTQKNLKRVKDSPMNLVRGVQNFLRYILMGRIGITVFLLGWVLLMTVLVVYPQPTKGIRQEEEGGGITNYIMSDDENYNRYYNLHRIWFGDQSLIMIVFKLWYYAIMLWMLGPFLRELVTFVRLRMFL